MNLNLLISNKLYCEYNKVPGHPNAIFDCAIGSGSYFIFSVVFSFGYAYLAVEKFFERS